MGQSSYVYILWIVILAAGLWFIIGFGATLHAQEDLAGEWELTPDRPAAHAESSRMKVEQSGQYFSIAMPNRSAMRLKIAEQEIFDQRFGEHKRIVLRGNGTTASFEGRSGGDLWRFSIDAGANSHEAFVARLVERTYPKPLPATQPASASTSHAR